MLYFSIKFRACLRSASYSQPVLSTLISRFTLEVHPAPPQAATLGVLEDAQGRPCKALFQPRAAGFELGAARAVVAARVDWGGISNPLVSALPDRIEVDLTCDEETMALAMTPYPRSPQADTALKEAGVLSEEQAGPFAALLALKGEG